MKNIHLAFLLFLIGSFAGCKKQEVTYIPSNETEIRIGALLPLSGTGQSSGIAMKVSIELAAEDINAFFTSSGINQKLSLEVVDTKTDTAEALKHLKTFYDKGIRMIIGPYSSAELSHIKNFADSNGMLVVSPSSVAVSLAIPNDNIFRFVSSDVMQGKAMSKMLSEDKIKVIVPVIRNDLWGNDLVNATGTDFINCGGMVQTSVRIEPGDTGLAAALDELDAAVAEALTHHNPNELAVYMLSFAEGTQILTEAKKHEHLNNVYWYGGSAYAQNASLLSDTAAVLFAYTHGLPCPIFGLDEAAKNIWQPLKNRIESQIAQTPDAYAFTAYDAVWVLTKAYRSAGKNPSCDMLKEVFMNEAGSYFGASGNTMLDVNGDRAVGNYDFWAVKSDSAGYSWKRIARYNSLYGTLTRLKE
jgi:branched-chain amino acid transport system substrate-binding protein